MPLQLLPATAQAFAARAAPTIVLNSKPEQWLTQTLKRINRIKRPLNSIPQHFKCLTETLGGEAAIWTLASIMLPKAPDSELQQDSNPLVEALYNYQLIHIEAYVVHVDMVSQHEVAFKLTPETIDGLVEYHRDIYLVDLAANAPTWPERDAQVKRMQEEFVQAANRFVFRTGVHALEGLEEDGAGELLDGRAAEVKTAVTNLFQQLLPPPPRIVDVIHPAPLLPSPHYGQTMASSPWWAPAQQNSLALPQSHFHHHHHHHQHNSHPAPVDSWKVLPSTPSPTATSCSDHLPTTMWQDMSSLVAAAQLPSPTPSFSQTSAQHHRDSYSAAPMSYYSSPECMTPMPSLQLPSASLSSHCGTDMASFGMGGFHDFGWSAGGFVSQYATAVQVSC